MIGTDYEEDKPASENEVGSGVDMHGVGTAMVAITGRGINPKAIAFPGGFRTDDA